LSIIYNLNIYYIFKCSKITLYSVRNKKTKNQQNYDNFKFFIFYFNVNNLYLFILRIHGYLIILFCGV